MKFFCYRTALILLLAIFVCGNTFAAKKKTKKAKKEEVVEKVDTVPMADFSYAMGIAQTNGLVNYLAQRMGVDTVFIADFLQAFEQFDVNDKRQRAQYVGMETRQQMESQLGSGYISDFLQAFEQFDVNNKQQKAQYTGMGIRQQVEEQLITQLNRQINDENYLLNKALFIQGFRDAIAGTAHITTDSAQTVANKQMEYYQKVKMEAKYGQNRIDGENFLKANAKKDSIKTTESGLQYKILTAGTGAIPTATQKVKVNYEGRLLDGTVFDSSYKRGKPAEFGCNQVIKGWTEALTMMPVGSKWELYIPQELGYGAREAGKIPPLSTLIFTVELLEIVP